MIASYPRLFHRVVPQDQSMLADSYVGMCHFYLWQFGEWRHVTVDDRLPVRKSTDHLLFVQSADKTQYWPSLLEKAFAKIHGCYSNLRSSLQSEVMEAFTGGVCVDIPLSVHSPPRNLFGRMRQYAGMPCLVGCNLYACAPTAFLDKGLIGGQTYSLTAVETVMVRAQGIESAKSLNVEQPLVRLRTPWGISSEWKGPWSEKSREWEMVSRERKEELKSRFPNNCEFWMSFKDFSSSFSLIEVCFLSMEGLEDEEQFQYKQPVNIVTVQGNWVPNVNAGGKLETTEFYATNPQFQFDVPENENEDHELVVISLLLCDFRKRNPPKIRQIGFRIYSLTQQHNSPLSATELTSLPTVYNTECQSKATVTVLLQLIQGSYLIIPSTEEPNQRGDFKIRLVSQFKASLWELDRPNKQLEITAEQEMMTPSVVQSEQNIRTCVKIFDRHCDKESYTIDAVQLRKLFKDNHPKGISGFDGFDLETCRQMINTFSTENEPYLSMKEFLELSSYIHTLSTEFLQHCPPHKGQIPMIHLRKAFESAGYSTSNKVFTTLVQRHHCSKTDTVNFREFTTCALSMKYIYQNAIKQPNLINGCSPDLLEDYIVGFLRM
ncbi:Calpain [Clonorchis sinensis]|uniref:Calpain n=1 Tax=Clonorchis sinensis TaxID=79923 RepID=A0A8T1MYF7_CLOSI|nr:Calpain [Clonorchis sinensis]